MPETIAATAEVHGPAGLRRQLGLSSAIAVLVGEVIAVGIFLTPAQMARALGSPFWLLVCWLLMGFMALLGAFCYGELAARYPEAGGGYVYLREAYGRGIAFLYGWKCLFVMDPGLTAALAVGMSSYAGYAVGLSPWGQKVVAMAAIGIIAGANALGLRLGAGVLRSLTFLKLTLLGMLILWGFLLQRGDWGNFLPFVAQRPGSLPLPAALATGMVAAFFSFGGWWDAAKLAGEVRDPERTLPRALLIGVTAVTAAYLLTSAVFLYLVPIEGVTTGEAFAAQAGEALFGQAGGMVFAGIVIVAVLSSLAGIIMAAPRVYYALARDGLFLPAVAAVHPRFGTPARAIGIQAALAISLVALGTFNQIIAYFVFVTVLFVTLTVAGLFIIRRRAAGPARRPTPGYPLTPVLFLALSALLLFLLASQSPKQALLGAGVVALGWPVYLLAFRRRTMSTRSRS